MYTQVECPDVVTANGATDSAIVRADNVWDDGETITLYAPAAAEAGTIQITDDPNIPVPNWYTLQVGGADLASPLPGKAISFQPAGRAFRIHYAAPVVAQRVYAMTKRIRIT